MHKLRSLFLVVGLCFLLLAGAVAVIHFDPPYTVVSWNCGTQGYHNILFPGELSQEVVSPHSGYIDMPMFIGSWVIMNKGIPEERLVVTYVLDAAADCPDGFRALRVYDGKSSRYWEWKDLKPIPCTAERYQEIISDQWKRTRNSSFTPIADQRAATFDGEVGPYEILTWERSWISRSWPLDETAIETVYHDLSDSKFYMGSVVQDKDGKILAYAYKLVNETFWHMFIYDEERNHFRTYTKSEVKV